MLTRLIVACVIVVTVRCHENVSTVQEMKIGVECSSNQQSHVFITVPVCLPQGCICPEQFCPKCETIPPLPPVRIATPTGSGYELFPHLGHYKFHSYGATWEQGQQRCSEEGAHLIIINSQREAAVVVTLFARYPTVPGAEQTGWAWTGIHERGWNGNYVTIFGDPLADTGFSIWSATEPNDGGPNDCVLTNRINAFLADAACYLQFAFICELEL